MQRIYDQSGLSNIGQLINHSAIVDGKCGNGLNFSDHSYISLFGDEFRQKPSNAISISVWVRLNTNRYTNVN